MRGYGVQTSLNPLKLWGPGVLLIIGVVVLQGCFTVSAATQGTTSQQTNHLAPKSTDPTAENRLLQWNLDSLVGDYEHHGNHGSRWDKEAKSALLSFAQIRAGSRDESLSSNLTAQVSIAVSNGCDDPMIKYLYLRSAKLDVNRTAQQQAEAFAAVATAMKEANRPPIRRFYAALYTANSFNSGSVTSLAELHKWRVQAKDALVEVAQDKNAPVSEIYDAWSRLLDATEKSKREYDDAYFALEPVVFQNWPENAELLAIKGRFYTDYAWEGRGSGPASSVTSEGWTFFTRRLDIAESALSEAWKLNPTNANIARQMIRVELGKGRGREYMERWFERAMNLDPNYYEACAAKLHYLQPQWHGSWG
jgi:tetratricopeptide (TPR) repeat protein